jgi:CSLREA domain-containing protein
MPHAPRPLRMPRAKRSAPGVSRKVQSVRLFALGTLLFALIALPFIARTRAAGTTDSSQSSASPFYSSRIAHYASRYSWLGNDYDNFNKIFATTSARTLSPPPLATCTSIGSGAWNIAANWANCGGTFPGSADAAIIDNGTTITLDTNRTVASATVNSGGTLDAGANTLVVSGTFTLVANSTFRQGGGVQTPPGATRSFDNASTFVFNGSQSAISGFFTFGNLTWSSNVNGTPGGNLQVNGNLTVLNIQLRGATGTTTTSRTHTINGNVIIDGASAALVGNNATAAGIGTWNIGGSVTTQNGGILRGSNPSSPGDGVFNIGGDLINNGTVEHGTGTGVFTLNFNGTSTQAISGNPITSLQHLTISNTSNTVTSNVALTSNGTLTVNANASLTLGSTYSTSGTTSVGGTLALGGSFSTSSTFNVVSAGVLNCGTNVVSGLGTFNLQPGGTLGIGSPNGIAGLVPFPGLSGNIQTQNRIFNSAANYNYNGSTNQVTGNGPGFNSTPGVVNNLTIANSGSSGNNTVTLSQPISVNGTFTLTSGLFGTTSTNLLTVLNTATGAVSGGSSTSYVTGPMARTLPASLSGSSTYAFPVGKGSFNQFELLNPTTTSGGTVTVQAEEFDGNSGGTPGTQMASLNTNRYWSGSITSGGANFTNTYVRLTDSVAVATDSHIGKSATQGGSYNSIGGTVVGSTIVSGQFSSFSFFAIGDGINPPSIQKLFGTSPITVGGSSMMTLSVTNPNFGQTLTGIAFSDTLPTGLSFNGDFSAPLCGGTISVVGATISLTGGVEGPTSGDCNISLPVNANGAATGLLTNTTSAVTSTNGGTGNSASAQITVNPAVLKYRTKQNGDWNNVNTWETSPDGTTWTAATSGQTPTSAEDTINIRNGHTVTVTTSANADQATVDSGGTLIVNSGQTLTIDNGTGTDLTIDGTTNFGSTGVIAGAGSVAVNGTIGVASTDATDALATNVTAPFILNTGSSTVNFNGAGGQGIGARNYYNLTFSNNAKTLASSGTIGIAGTFTPGTNTSHTTTNSTIEFNGTSSQAVPVFHTYNNLTLNNTAGTTGASGLKVNDTLTVQQGTFTSASDYHHVVINSGGTLTLNGPITVSGDWTNNGTLTHNGNLVTFDGTGAQTITTGGLGAGKTFAGFVVNKASGAASLAGDLSAQAVTVTAGTFAQGSSTFSVTTTGSGTVATAGSSGKWTNYGTGDLLLSGNVTNNGTIEFNGNGTACGDNDDISISSTGSARTWSGTGTFSMTDVTVANQSAGIPPITILVNSGTDANGNTGWTFVDQCTAGTYTWIGGTLGANTDWQVATNWNPTRVTPAAADILIFDGTSTPAPIVTNVPTQTISSLQLKNNVNAASLNASAVSPPHTLTITGNAGLSVASGSRLELAGSNGLTVSVTTGTGSTINGQINLKGGPHRLTGANTGQITFASGAMFSAGTPSPASGFSGYPFGQGTTDSVRFQDGSNAFFNEGLDPFGGSGNAVATFTSASNQEFNTSTAWSAAGRSYGNLTLAGASQTYFDSGASSQVTVMGNLTIANGSTLKLSDSSGGDLNLWGNFTDNGTFDPNGRTVKFQGAALTQTISKSSGGETFFDLLIGKTGGSVQLLSPVTINGALTFDSGGTPIDVLELNAQQLTLNGTVGAVPNANSGLKGDLLGSGLNITTPAAVGTVHFIPGGESLSSLVVNGHPTNTLVSFDTSVDIGLTIPGTPTLVLTNGVADMGSNTLTLASGLSVSRTNGYVIGNLKRFMTLSAGDHLRTYPVGTINGYSPVDFLYHISTIGTYDQTVKAIQGQHPNISGANALQRYWTLSSISGPSSATADVTFNYLDVSPGMDIPAGATESNFQLFRYNGSFTQVPATVDAANNKATATNVGSFSDWTLAEAAAVEEGTLQFSATNFNDNETNADHTATITVTRTGGTDGAVSVQWATSANTATPGTDYVEASGVLNWADNEGGAKTFTVTVKGDTDFEPDELVNLTLSLPTGGATIGGTNPATLTIQDDDNTSPTITAAAGLTREQGSPSANSQIATVNDTESGANGVTVTVNGLASATVNGVTVSNIVNTNGSVTADIVADCSATPPNASFTLTATDGNGATATDTLTIAITANTPPVLTYSSPQTVAEGNALTINPATGPTDTGAYSIAVQDPGTYTGNIAVNNTTGVVTITNAAPTGSHTITIRITDACGFVDAQFTLDVDAAVCTAPPANMVAWYPGDGNANDIQGPTLENGTLQNGATFAAGKVNQAFSFDGSNDYVETTDFFDLNNSGDEITIDAWIKRSTTGDAGIVTKWVNAAENGWWFRISGNRFNWGTAVSGVYHQWSSNALFTDTANFHHVALVLKSGDPSSLKVYLDGVELSGSFTSGDGTQVPPDTAQNVLIGTLVPGGEVMNGVIDELELYNRALSQAEILAIYNASFAGNCRECTTPPTKMQAWLPAEGNANDIAGPNNGTFAANTYAPGKVGQAFSFDGVNDNVSLPNIVYGSSFSVDAWIKTNTVPAGLGTIIDEIGATTNEGFQCQVSAEPTHVGQVRFYLSDDTNTVITYSTALVNDGVFHHVACVKNGNTAEVYVDGVLSGTGNVSSVTGIYDAVTGGTSIGAARLGAGQFFQGVIDEVEIFNRALTATEVAAIANAGNAGKCHTSAVTVDVDPASVTEDGAGNLVYTFRRSGDITTAVTVNFSIAGTASFSGNDYSQTGATTYDSPTGQGTLAFLANEGTKTVTIDPTSDTTVEPDETVILTVTSGAGYLVGNPDTATGTITNDDATLTLVKTVVNNNGGNKVVSDFPLFIDGNPVTSGTSITVSANAVHTASETTQTGYAPSAWGTDCNADGTITLQPGENKTCTITNDDVAPTLTLVKTVVNDSGGSKVVSDFPLFINGNGVTSGTQNTLTANVLYTASETTQTGYAASVWGGHCAADGTITLQPGDNKTCTITNDDVLPTISIDNVSHAEGNTSTVDYDFTVSLSYSSTETITVNYATANDTAVAPGDYTAVSGQLTFNPGETIKPVKVVANTDTVYELDEAFVVNLSSPVNATTADGEGRGTITNDDPQPNLSIGNVIKFEGTTPGTVSFDFTVTKSGNATGVNATVNYTTAEGTASENTTAACSGTFDYQFKTGSLTFAPLEFTKTITIVVCKDSTFEADETFFVNLSGETNANVSDGQGQGTIANDDTAPPLSPVNTTNDVNDGACNASHCSLREAINAANASSGSVSIIFAIPANDARHFYYTDDGASGQVSLINITTTTAADDSGLVNPDPDWAHSWWSILPTAALPPLNTTAVGATIDGYSQSGASADTAAAGHNGILRIEVNGSGIPGGVTYGLEIDNGSNTVTGLIINRFLGTGGPGTGNGVGMTDSSDAIRGNFIGTDPSGTIDVGNAGSGVVVTVSNVNIGGANVGDANLISGNDGHGIAITGNSVVVQGNYIGTKANGTSALPNTLNGVAFNGGGAVFNTLGGTGAGEANLIGFNGQDGVNASGGFSNIIRGNSLFSNGTTSAHLGIDLGADGVTANDPLDADSGPNDLQNFPIIRTALAGTPNRIRGTLNSEANQTYTIDLYANDASTGCDTSGNGEGKTYLGSTTADTGANGDALWSINPTVLNAGEFITATATDSSGNTSEFSACFQATGLNPGTAQFVSAPYTDSETNADHTVTITVSRTGGSNLAMDVTYQTSDGSATLADNDYVAASGTLHWNNGETGNKTFTITVKGDTIFEGDETVNITLSGATISGTNPTTLTITNDDPQPALSINDVALAEGNAGTKNFTFTVSKTNHGAVSVNYQTQNGTATTGNSDYQSTSGTLSWGALDTTPQTITVLVNGDSAPELDETFNVLLSGEVGAMLTDGTGLGTILNDDESVSAGQLIISEFRLSGPGANPAAQANNEFIELYNATDQDLFVTTTDGSTGWAVANSSGVPIFFIPNGTTIPAREHFLGTNTSGYSLYTYPAGDGTFATGDATWTTDVPDNTALAVFRTNNAANFNTTNRLDSVGPNSETNTLYREGSGYLPLAPADLAKNLEHTFFRQICVFQAGCPTPGRPRDTQDNAADFIFADTIGANTSAGQRLGSPGPENLSSPIKRDPAVNLVFLDATVSDGSAPNRDRNTTSDPANASQFGTMTIRRRVVNQTGGAVTRLRFRVIDMTTHPSGPLADLRLRSSLDQTIVGINDVNTCAATGTPTSPSCTVTVKGLTLEQPPNVTAANGGGLNTTVILPLPSGLADGQSINVQFLLGVQKTGPFRFYLVIEALP